MTNRSCKRCGTTENLVKSKWHMCNKCAYAESMEKGHKGTSPMERRIKLIKSKYGLTRDAYMNMVVEQSDRCAICLTDKPGLGAKSQLPKSWQWHVDHDHQTGKVRGLLCGHCNTSLGHFDDDVLTLQAAIDYLEESWCYQKMF